jgi:hypothetical protein
MGRFHVKKCGRIKMPKPKTMQVGHSNDFQTPPWVLDPLYQYLPDGLIWECACGNRNLSKRLYERGYATWATDILTGQDFLTTTMNGWVKCIVTNPPYTLKNKFLARCYELGVPFALLLPLTTFETPFRQNLFRSYGIEVIFLPKRVEFETPSGQGAGSWFATAWFTHGLNIGKELTFWEG